MSYDNTYHAGAANVPRTMRFRIEPVDATESSPDLFGMLKGDWGDDSIAPNAMTTVPTPNELLAQLRTDLVIQALMRWSQPVEIRFVADSHGATVGSHNFGPALEVALYGRFLPGGLFNEAWIADPTQPRFVTSDVTDSKGDGGMIWGPKTRPGLQTVLNDLAGISYDGGVTGPFGALSAGGAVTLPDGQVTAAAPTLSTGSGTQACGLVIVPLE